MQMSMAGQGDADTHGQTLRVNMMECARRHVDKVSRFGVDHITSLDLPVDFTFQHDPEFVIGVAVIVIGGRFVLMDDDTDNMVGQRHRMGPGRCAFLRFDLIEGDVVEGRGQDRVLQGHGCTSI